MGLSTVLPYMCQTKDLLSDVIYFYSNVFTREIVHSRYEFRYKIVFSEMERERGRFPERLKSFGTNFYLTLVLIHESQMKIVYCTYIFIVMIGGNNSTLICIHRTNIV